MRKVIVYIATSADGFIARPDGDIGWLNRPRVAGNYGMNDFYRSIDTVLMGRKTHDVGMKLGQASYTGKKNYIFSRTRRQSAGLDVEFIAQEAGEFAKDLRRSPGKDIWLVGGGELIASLLECGQVDEFIIHVIPILIGEGIPLIAARHCSVPLALLSSRSFADGVVRLHYRVERRAEGKSSGEKRPRRRSS
jgi:dihydrofolate reductase